MCLKAVKRERFRLHPRYIGCESPDLRYFSVIFLIPQNRVVFRFFLFSFPTHCPLQCHDCVALELVHYPTWSAKLALQRPKMSWYQFVIIATTVTSLCMQVYVIFIIIRKSPDAMSEYRYFICFIAVGS